MIRYIAGLALRLYPRWWRTRYSQEFDALLDDMAVSPSDVLSMLREVAKIRIQTAAMWKVACFFAVMGAGIAFMIGLMMPVKYVSSAVIRVSSGKDSFRASQYVNEVALLVLGADFLAELSEREKVYPKDLERMRRSIGISAVSRVTASSDTGFQISFVSNNGALSQRVVTDLTNALLRAGAETDGEFRMSLLEPPSLPSRPSSPNLFAAASMGGAWGLIVGLSVVALRARIWPDPPRLAA